MSNILGAVNQQIDKAQDLKYFTFLATFVLFFDTFLSVYKQSSLLVFTATINLKNIPIGEILIFFLCFSLYLSFIVPFVTSILSAISQFPFFEKIDFTFDREFENLPLKDKVRTYELKRYAVKTSNSVAYNFALEHERRQTDVNQFRFSCTAFILTSVFNFVLSNKGITHSIFVELVQKDQPIWYGISAIVFAAIFIFTGYIGVFVAGGFTCHKLDDNYIYFKNHDMNT